MIDLRPVVWVNALGSVLAYHLPLLQPKENEMNNKSSMSIGDGGIRILDVEVPGKDVAQFFAVAKEEERHLLLIQAIEVGTFCLERARGNSDMEFVRRQV